MDLFKNRLQKTEKRVNDLYTGARRYIIHIATNTPLLRSSEITSILSQECYYKIHKVVLNQCSLTFSYIWSKNRVNQQMIERISRL